jgi:hypothetical protein
VSSSRTAPRSYKEDNCGNQVSSVRESVKIRSNWRGAAVQRELEPRGKGITIVRSRYQETFSEATAGCRLEKT